MASTLVYLVRHAQTAENDRGIIQGQLDTHLDAIGRVEQAPAISHALRDIPFDICFTSALTRAAETAEVILRDYPGVELHRLPLLQQRFRGSVQGCARAELPPEDPPDDEPPEAFSTRTLQFWDDVVVSRIEAARGNPLCLLVVSHGAFICALIRKLMEYRNVRKAPGVTLSEWSPNASITLVEIRVDGTGTLLKFGDTSHLAVQPTVQ